MPVDLTWDRVAGQGEWNAVPLPLGIPSGGLGRLTVDSFGHLWIVSQGCEGLSKEEVQKRIDRSS